MLSCGIEMKKFVLFPATDLTSGELRGELSECESKEKLVGNNHRF
jgi:hypothetical protein